ncbi:MAG: hypothetical protein A3G24_13510 [Betaproteobacteria bacterium RIFCSPLOWO2_12_FULL_62_13]|nr:MAG: hypothetical protein A3G24_13510 [Betaproteobacteria bacterium RIFCSPLOWO2_12_FULL_62_13]
MLKRRSYLFLQGACSPFFTRLGDRLRERAHAVHRINFNMGDACYWGRRPAWNFRQQVEHLPGYLEEKFRAVGFSDVVSLGDTRPVNEAVFPLAERLGVRVHVFEEGYFRPNWLTLERGGINGNSRLPRNPDWYRDVGARLPDCGEGEPLSNPLPLIAFHELAYHLPNVLNPVFFPGYRTHRPHISGVEFYGWGRRFATLPWRRDNKVVSDLLAGNARSYVLALQLDSDSQMTCHSPFAEVVQVIETVAASFARFAPEDALLVVKNHPLDTGFTDYRGLLRRLERELDVAGRTIYLESGDLSALLRCASGVVTVNSTAGAAALAQGRPTIALGNAIYNMPGLTFQGLLDEFWNNAGAPDGALFRVFRNTVIHATQVNGGFYSRQGIEMGVENSVSRLESERSPLEELL